MRVETIKIIEAFKGFFRLNRYHLRHELHNGGMSAEIGREVFERNDAVMVIPYDAAKQKVVMISQFRPGAHAHNVIYHRNDSPWLLEFPAGMIEAGQTPAEAALRECAEETGCVVHTVTPIYEYFTSPGGCCEKLHLCIATVDTTTAGGIHGLEHEHEDLKVEVFDISDLNELIALGRVKDASSIIGVQWLLLSHNQQ
jgi:ADP-ribose pyrophosphatase